MADIRKWDPFEEWKDFREKVGEKFLMFPFQSARAMREIGQGAWYPAVDMKETSDQIIVTAELAGMNDDDIEINVTEEMLQLNGQRKEVKEVSRNEEGWIRRERSYGKFTRALSLPAKIKVDKVEASFKNGVLTITLPKLEESRPKGKRIKIKKEEG